jgi:hypothetical protein
MWRDLRDGGGIKLSIYGKIMTYHQRLNHGIIIARRNNQISYQKLFGIYIYLRAHGLID